MIAKGTAVHIKGTELDGEVVGYRVSTDETEFLYLVNYEDAAGIAQQRGFSEQQITVKE